MNPTNERLRTAMAHMLTTTDDDWLPYLGVALTAFTSKMSVPKLAHPSEFSNLGAPVLAIGAEKDLSFPGHRVCERARQLFKGPVTAEVLEGCFHSPPTTDAFRAQMSKRLEAFLR
jgi:pimeloyl-ACP methyl ester carboxylesterase